jgi:3-hexulose-6-phosphate synthase
VRKNLIDALGVDYIFDQTGYDLQAVGQNSFEDLATLKSVVTYAKTAVTGAIKMETIPEVIAARPDLIIVGGGITGQDDKQETASTIHRMLQEA